MNKVYDTQVSHVLYHVSHVSDHVSRMSDHVSHIDHVQPYQGIFMFAFSVKPRWLSDIFFFFFSLSPIQFVVGEVFENISFVLCFLSFTCEDRSLHGIRCDRPTRLLHIYFVHLPFSIEFGLLAYFASSVFLTGKICCIMRSILKKNRAFDCVHSSNF